MSNSVKHKENTIKQEQGFPIIPLIIIFFITLFALVIGNRFLHNDFAIVLKWWAAILALGVAFFPVAHLVGGRFKDGGFVLSKGLGIAIGSWVVWTLSTFKLQKFTTMNAIATLVVCAILAYSLYIIFTRKSGKRPFESIDTNKIAYMFFYESLFLLVFIAACYMRSFRVTITPDTEKYMDFGFLASVLNAEYLPAEDMWFAGEPINYYYYGIYVSGYLARLCNTHAGYAYNLGLMTLAALGFVQVYQLTTELIVYSTKEHDKRMLAKDLKAKTTSPLKLHVMMHSAGLLSGVSVFAAGNMQYVLYAKIYPLFGKLLKKEVAAYWFPDATRFITDNYQGNEGTLIHEFPSYSFVLGDLHAHVTDIIFVFTIVPVLFAFLLNRKERMEKARDKAEFEKINYIKEALSPEILVASFMIGIIKTANYWDFFIYFVVAGGVLMFSNAIVTGFRRETFFITGIHAVECLVIGFIISFPFNMNFDSPSAGIGICLTHSNPYELAVLWALPVAASVGLFAVAINTYKERLAGLGLRKPKKGEIITFNPKENEYIFTKNKNVNHLFSFIFRAEFSDLFVLTLAACAIGLVIVPELIYVRDIYGGAYMRTNTMFKLAYQAFMLFGVVMSYAFVRFIGMAEKSNQRILAFVGLFFLLWTCNYFDEAINAYTGDLAKPNELTRDNYERTLDSYNTLGYTGEIRDAEADAIRWVIENTEGGDVVLTMGTTSYDGYAFISAWTGRPTVCGWAYHEWLWRNGGTLEFPDSVKERMYFQSSGSDVLTIYTSTDEEEVRRLIEKYDIKYIYVGQTETVNGMESGEDDEEHKHVKNRYATKIETNHELLKSLGTVVFEVETKMNYGYETYIVKVDR